jgi:6-phosphofructokinase 1
LVPEFDIDLYGDRGVLNYIYQRVLKKGRCVIVVAEGVGDNIRDIQHREIKERDASNNIKLENIQLFLKEEITKYFKERKTALNLKLIDPTYMIRAGTPNAYDTKMCT